MAAASATNGLPIRSILIFPALFTTAMSLVDTADGVLMLGAYGWALVEPRRRIYYNLAITMVSVAVAVAVGGVEVVGLLGDRLSLQGRFWRVIGWLNDNINLAGFALIGLSLAGWAAWALAHRAGGDVRSP